MAATVTAPLPHSQPPQPLQSSSTSQSQAQPLPNILLHHDPTSTPSYQLITQGAEALLYKTTYLFPSIPAALKHRPSKPYRHPTLDARLTKHRILSEARVLAKCRREGVPVPAVYALDEAAGWLLMEWVEGVVVREGIERLLGPKRIERIEEEEGNGDGEQEEEEREEEREKQKEKEDQLIDLMHRIGAAVGKLHATGIVHGDLTTSNLMLKPSSSSSSPPSSSSTTSSSLEGTIHLIDFGLASQSSADEDRAVDLYVLERAFGSTHPRAEKYFGELLGAYGGALRGNAGAVVLKRLEEVRMRGRKRSMVG